MMSGLCGSVYSNELQAVRTIFKFIRIRSIFIFSNISLKTVRDRLVICRFFIIVKY